MYRHSPPPNLVSIHSPTSVPTKPPDGEQTPGFAVATCCRSWRRRARGRGGERDTAFSPNSCLLGWCSREGGLGGCGIHPFRGRTEAFSGAGWGALARPPSPTREERRSVWVMNGPASRDHAARPCPHHQLSCLHLTSVLRHVLLEAGDWRRTPRPSSPPLHPPASWEGSWICSLRGAPPSSPGRAGPRPLAT